MSRLRRQVGNNLTNVAETKDLNEIKKKTGNLYESISIIAKRASQINISIKEELHNKLEEFASHTDSLEEIHENKEQIEKLISDQRGLLKDIAFGGAGSREKNVKLAKTLKKDVARLLTVLNEEKKVIVPEIKKEEVKVKKVAKKISPKK